MQIVDGILGCSLDEEADRQTLEGFPEFIEVASVSIGDRRYDGSLMRWNLDEAFGLQLPTGLANRVPGHVELFAQLSFDQSLAGQQVASDDLVAYRLDRLSPHRGGHYAVIFIRTSSDTLLECPTEGRYY